ncbi:SDR family oxidoreductase [Streptomyces sp. NPDC090306]|uniref:SDR family oxidoreductase n=1 Tax=Streptomyces sp. NPDC090306 TaxID=3365961 RepID=UPI0038191551
MRIFVTGASGWIGSAVVPELIDAGHTVVGLARSEASASALTAAGAEVVRGTVDDLDLLRETAAASDGVIHLAFKHDIAFTGDFKGAAEADRKAVDTFGDVLAGTDRPLVIASGVAGLAPGRVSTEQTMPEVDGSPVSERAATSLATLALAERGVRSVVVRLAPTVHGDGDNGFIASLVAVARDKGVSGYIGDGTNRWPAVHRLDAARLFRLAVEQAPAGSVLHGTAEEGVELREVAKVIGEGLDVPVESIAPESAPAHFTWLAAFLAMDAPTSSTHTQHLLNWTPTHPTLLEDLGKGYYFAPGATGA